MYAKIKYLKSGHTDDVFINQSTGVIYHTDNRYWKPWFNRHMNSFFERRPYVRQSDIEKVWDEVVEIIPVLGPPKDDWTISVSDKTFTLFPDSSGKVQGTNPCKDILGTNPKEKMGKAKPQLSAIPPVAILHLGQAMEDGKEKYGHMNWRESSISADTYYNAMLRHLFEWFDGQDHAEDSGRHHLAHIMASCAILLDAEASGTLVDDRPKNMESASNFIKSNTGEY